MPTVGAHFPDDEFPAVVIAAKIANQSPSAYGAEAIRERMRREGHVAGNPAFDVRAEAISTAEMVGADAVLRSLRRLRNKRSSGASA